MDIVPMVLAGVGGIFAGMLLTSRVVGWLQAIAAARSVPGESGASSTPLAVVVFLHSGPWLLIATLVGAFLAFAKSSEEGWTWFFSGVVIAPLVLIPAAILISRRNAKTKQESSADAA